TRIVSDAHRKRMWKVNGLVDPSFLVDGYVAGTWNVSQTKREALLDIAPFDAPVPRAVRTELEAEGLRLLSFLAPRTERHNVVVHSSVDA
nr:winged helix DNA-binding domain-containing protein [Chloroflexia bacterium]